MSLTKLLRTVILGLLGLLGLLICIGIAVWWHELWYGMLNPDKIEPARSWMLGLVLGMVYIQIAVTIETLLVGLVTRLRWIKYKRGRAIVGLFSLTTLLFALPLLTDIVLVRPGDIVSFLQFLLFLILPLVPA